MNNIESDPDKVQAEAVIIDELTFDGDWTDDVLRRSSEYFAITDEQNAG